MAYTTIDDPSKYFQTAIYTGNGSGQAITFDGNSDMQPDFFWGKCRSTSSGNHLQNSTTGVKPFLVSNSTAAENTDNNNTDFLSYDSDGFTLGASYQTDINHNARTYVAWCWKANGGTTTTNDASSTSVGNQDSVYQANTDAGFSIVTWAGQNQVGTMAHGLGAVPNWIIVKARGGTEGWGVYHHKNTASPETDHLRLDTTDATLDSTNVSNDTAPTSSVFTVGDSGIANENDKTYVAYLFAEKQGYSKFGSYTANNSTDGPFVYLGFKPAWIMVKNTSAAADWPITDNKREVGNPFGEEMLFANGSDAETSYSGGGIDFVSNGFKIRSSGTNGVHNANNTSHTFIYMAFAESPFVSSKGVPTTAR